MLHLATPLSHLAKKHGRYPLYPRQEGRYVDLMTLTPEQRTAQKVLVGMLNRRSFMWFEPGDRLCIWRSQSPIVAGAEEVSQHFDALEIPYGIRIELMKVGKQKKGGVTLTVSWDDLEAITRWAPSFQKHVDQARAQLAELNQS